MHIDDERVPVKSDQQLKPEQVVTYREAGGGGFGEPTDRSSERIQYDLENGYISEEQARDCYDIESQSE